MSKQDQALIEFQPKLPKLSSSEKAVLKLLVEAARLIGPLYKMQENEAFPGANFYPHDATKEELEKAAQKDPQILSPYTIVERTEKGLVAIPYHIKYADHLKPIAVKLEQAAKTSHNKAFKKALLLQAKALLDGSYDQATAAWLGMKPYLLDISIGPDDYFDDQLLFVKNSYQAWVGVLDIEGSERLNNYKSTILAARRQGLIPTERIDNYDKIKAKVLETIIFSGLMAKTKFPGVNYPINVDIVEKHGSEITLFNQPNDLMIQKEVLPVFQKVFSKEFKQGYNLEDLRRGNLRYIAMHELAHSYLYYRHASDHLKDLFRPIYELAATVLGLRLSGSLLLKERITSKQLESMIVAWLSRSLYLANNKKEVDKSLTEYVLGSIIFINFLVESGALKIVKGVVVLNFMKIFMALNDLSHILEDLLSSGTRDKAADFIKQYIRTQNFLS